MIDQLSRLFATEVPAGTYSQRHYLGLAALVSVGAVLRFWGLGNVGLAGDEETMAMPALSILETGLPYLPSGILYPRAVLQIYAMAGSVQMFGLSEWALRLPSAVIGAVGIVAAYFLGKRFLTPWWNLLFVSAVALLPALIETSQIARMYIFLATCLMIFGALVFRWERTGRTVDLIFAVLAFALALQFHVLAAFGSLLFLFPCLTRGTWRTFVEGAIAFTLTLSAAVLRQISIRARFPGNPVTNATTEPDRLLALKVFALDHAALAVSALAAGAIVLVVAARLGRSRGRASMLAHALFAASIVASVLLQYHAAALLFLGATIVRLRLATRWDARELAAIALIAAFIAALAIVQLAILMGDPQFPGRRILGAMLGYPSVWSYIRFSEFTLGGCLLYLPVLGYVALRLAQGGRIPDHVALFVLCAWAPMLVMGVASWYPAPRYLFGILPFFLLCVVAGGQYLASELGQTGRRRGTIAIQAAMLVVLVNPLVLSQTVNPTYGRHPDHKGAAEFVRSLDLSPDDILVAEDVLQQTYYLGGVDYWLTPLAQARAFAMERDGQVVDRYTATPVLDSAEAFRTLLDTRGDRTVVVIGSGENFANGYRTLRDPEVAGILESDSVHMAHLGRDGRTSVWIAAPIN